ncbi:hypothetical protein GOP47_0029133 [Adiantum capillus-veneris]|nr:hypothetical protein GOP47_0029133 [Adiantum capillus-veneris]
MTTTFSTSEKRLTRSQARAGAPSVASKTPNGASTPSSAAQRTQGFSKAGRRVLAELACNDSPIIGLLPAGTPTSCKDKSSDGGPVRIRRALLADAVATHPACTPLGESLLRSQVQLLLQKVGSDTNQLEKAPYMCLGNAMAASPTMLAAPTPLNTPASSAITQVPQPNFQREISLSSQNSTMDSTMQVAGCPTSSNMLAKHPDSHVESLDAAPMGTHCLLESVSAALITDVQPPLLIEVSNTPSSSEIFIGKRVLHFDDDTPCKTLQENPSSRVCLSEETGHSTTVMRQLDDDETSEWSVSVNVGSPAEKQCLAEVCGGITGDTSSSSVEKPIMLRVDTERMQQVSSRKVHLLWDEESVRKVVEHEKRFEPLCDEDEESPENENDEEYFEDYYCGEEDEGAYEGGEECEDLCDMFRDMGFGEHSKGLPKGEGKHIRFFYEDGDEIMEAMVVNGEEDVLCSSGAAVRLRGVPAPLGRHWRFAQDEE